MKKFYHFWKFNGYWHVTGGRGTVFAGSGTTVRAAWSDALSTYLRIQQGQS